MSSSHSISHTSSHPGILRLTLAKIFSLPGLLFLFIAVLAALSCSNRLMWYDEVATYEPARLPSVSQTLSFFTSGTDTPGPLPSLALHGSMLVWGDGDFRNRLPFALFFLGSCAFVYAFAARRYPPLYSAIALVLPAALGTFQYASEMRAYAFVLFFTSLMMVCWQRIEDRPSRALALTGLWLAFAGAVLSHAFAVFLFVPFALAEASRAFLRKRVDKLAWGVLFTAPLALLLLLPGIHRAHEYYGKTFWSRPSLHDALAAYGPSFLGQSSRFLAFGSVLIALVITRLNWNGSVPAKRQTGFTLPEWVLVLVLLLLPLYALVGSLPLGVYVTRYTIPFVLGLDLAFVGFIAWSSRFSRKAALSILLLIAAAAVVKQHNPIAHALHGFRPAPARQYRQQQWMAYACSSNLPVLASSPQDFLVWQHYGSSCLKKHLYYAEDLVRAREAGAEINMDLFKKMLPLRVVGFDSFIRSHPVFLLADAVPDWEWLLPYIQSPAGKKAFRIDSEISFPNTVTEPYRGFQTNKITLYNIVRN